MKISKLAIVPVVALLLAPLTSVYSADKSGQRAVQNDRMQQSDRLKDYDRDRDRDRLHDGSCNGDATCEKLKQRDRDRVKSQDHLGVDIYGSDKMNEGELNQYRNRIEGAKSEQERNQIRMQHQEEIRTREQDQSGMLDEE